MSRMSPISVLWVMTEFIFVLSFSFRPKSFKLESFENCPGSENLPARFRDVKILMPKLNLYTISALIEVDQNVTVQQAISLSVKRCTMDKTHCEDYDHLTISKFCDLQRDVKTFWAPMVNMVQPPIPCPTPQGVYRMTNATANLSIVSRLPLDGYRWVVKFTFHQDGNPKNVFMCLDVEVTIRNQNRRRN